MFANEFREIIRVIIGDTCERIVINDILYRFLIVVIFFNEICELDFEILEVRDLCGMRKFKIPDTPSSDEHSFEESIR